MHAEESRRATSSAAFAFLRFRSIRSSVAVSTCSAVAAGGTFALKPTHLLAVLLGCVLVSEAQVATRIEKPLVVVSNPPPVQMLVPGFTVRELPLKLNNINNLVFAPDGRLFALCYDGNVLQLQDTDGDGLEETATHFYKNDKNEILPSIGMCWGPGGLFIASQRRVIHLRDNGDGTAEMMTVTGGWVPQRLGRGRIWMRLASPWTKAGIFSSALAAMPGIRPIE